MVDSEWVTPMRQQRHRFTEMIAIQNHFSLALECREGNMSIWSIPIFFLRNRHNEIYIQGYLLQGERISDLLPNLSLDRNDWQWRSAIIAWLLIWDGFIGQTLFWSSVVVKTRSWFLQRDFLQGSITYFISWNVKFIFLRKVQIDIGETYFKIVDKSHNFLLPDRS